MNETALDNSPKIRAQVCLVSGQPMANLLPLFLLGADDVYLIVTPQMRDAAGSLEGTIKSRMPCCRIHLMELPNAYDFDAVVDAVYGILDADEKSCAGAAAENLHFESGEIVLNATGGTKLMMLAAVRVFSEFEKKILYLSEETGDVLLLTPDSARALASGSGRTSTRIKLRLKDYFMAHGFAWSVKAEAAVKASSAFYTELIARQQQHAQGVAALNALAQKALQNSRGQSGVRALRAEMESSGSGVRYVLGLFQDEGVLAIKGSEVFFPDEARRFFANGGWLEDYAYDVVESMEGARMVEKNIRISSDGDDPVRKADYELDVSFLHGNKIVVVECKTCDMTSTKETTPILNKLSVIREKLGNTAVAVLVSYQRVNAAAKERAQKNGIYVIDGNSVCQLKARLRDILDGGTSQKPGRRKSS